MCFKAIRLVFMRMLCVVKGSVRELRVYDVVHRSTLESFTAIAPCVKVHAC